MLKSIISVMTNGKLIRNGCPAWLSYVRELKRKNRIDKYFYCEGISGCIPRGITWVSPSPGG